MPSGVYKRTKPIWNKGKKLSEEHKKHLRNKRPSTKGPLNHNWRGGNSRAYKDGYYSNEYKKWRLEVFNRDSFTCLGCGEVGGYLTAHHIKSFRNFPELRFDISNGVTLCEACHAKTDSYKGHAKGNKNI